MEEAATEGIEERRVSTIPGSLLVSERIREFVRGPSCELDRSIAGRTHVRDDANDGADEDGEEVPGLNGDPDRRGDAPDDETGKHGVPEGFELRALPLRLRRDRSVPCLHDRRRSRARGDDALRGSAVGDRGRDIALAKLHGRIDVALEELRGAHAGVRLRRATRVVGNPASGSPRRISGANVGRDRRSGRVRHHHGGHLNVDTFDQTDGRRHTPRVSNWRDDARDCAFPRITLLSQS